MKLSLLRVKNITVSSINKFHLLNTLTSVHVTRLKAGIPIFRRDHPQGWNYILPPSDAMTVKMRKLDPLTGVLTVVSAVYTRHS
jgi:hypothetical protein